MEKRVWKPIKEYTDILFEQYKGIAKITINRPEVYNAFRPLTNTEMLDAFDICRERGDIRVIVLTGAGDKAFCSGGDQNYKTQGGYRDSDGTPRLNVLDLHKMIRSIPKPVIAMVNTREIWYLCRQYTAKEAEEMGMINKVVPFDRLEDETVEWCETIMKRSPFAIRMIKRCLNAELDGQRGLMELAGDATLMYYLMDEAQEGKNAFLEKRDPDFEQFPKFPG